MGISKQEKGHLEWPYGYVCANNTFVHHKIASTLRSITVLLKQRTALLFKLFYFSN